ncbi:TPA: hypothetical protein HA235_07715 [Candidatus Woesearchaeota archaeon]|nr:hypothetical protein [Candidatus Woesearchaeota archaeon]HIH32566.1 hypothetical protein [Candidatus Woesearchaeota archaeon]HIH54801.1 hypothetical protein [Candidatus Woesearchaeota archaeon]HIJ02155.1 hypothetical protein [Candidatus Woesearchaeota archaeon]HIJ13639.1 hypothetical protein [Candidatus Woesearchaeota archaeon]
MICFDEDGNIIEDFANRNFNIGDRVIVFFNGINLKGWHGGEVVDKYFKDNKSIPYIMTRTDLMVDNSIGAYLNGYGVESRVDTYRIRFAHELNNEDKIYKKTFIRKPTDIEKKEHENMDNLPF